MKVPKNTPIRYLNEAEIFRLREAIGENLVLRRVVDLALWAGLRRNELNHVQWSDISFEQMTVTVQNKDDFRTKSGNSRVVPINA
jgi:integrase